MMTEDLATFAAFLWNDYNSKRIPVPDELTEKFMRLQGHSDEDIVLFFKEKTQKEKTKLEQTKHAEKKKKKDDKLNKLYQNIWKKYSSKGIRPPIDVAKKVAKLQGKSKEFIDTMEYEKFEGIIPPWKCDDVDDYFELWGDKTPIEIPKSLPVDPAHPLKMDAETTLEEIMTNKALVNPTPLYRYQPSNRGYIQVLN